MARKKLESDFVPEFKDELNARFPGGYILKQDAGMRGGIPDLLFLYEDRWASFETKRGRGAAKQPGQDYYVERMNEMSFSRFVNPDNMQEVLDELQEAFGT